MSLRRHLGDVGENLALPASSPSKVEMLDAMIAGLADLDADQLRLQWRNHLGGTVPVHLPRWLLLRVLAYRLQAAALGDLDKATLRILRASNGDGIDSTGSCPFEKRSPTMRDGIRLKAGALLVREWKGKPERVMVLDNGFAWNGKTYGSLSQVAKAMTGTSWNGHRFFGLRARPTVDRSVSAGRKASENIAGNESKRPIAKPCFPEGINAESLVISQHKRHPDLAGVAR